MCDRWKTSFLVALLLLGCGPVGSTESTGTGTGGTTMAANTSSGVTTSTSTTSTGVVGSSSSTTGEAADDTGPVPPPGFLSHPDVEYGYPCSLYADNCPPGEKCVPIANDGGSAWNALACRPIVDDPDAPGESCSITMGSAVDGYDTCEKHAMCWDVDRDTDQGTCVGLCIGSADAPTCLEADTYCSIGGESALALCLPTCDPLAQDCGEAQGCYPTDSGFACAPAAPPQGGGSLGAPCEYTNGCLRGFFCGLGEGFCPEDAFACCLPFCDLTDPDCPDILECVPAFEVGSAQAGLEHVGFCTVVD